MSGFVLDLRSATQFEEIPEVDSFVGEDDSGSFGLLAGHERFVTTLVFGLARFRRGPDWEYLAVPGGVLHFDANRLVLSTRHYLRDRDYRHISQALAVELTAEETRLQEMKETLERLEREMLQRLWHLGSHTGIEA